MMKTENKLSKTRKMIKEISLKYQDTGLRILRQLRVSRVHFLALGRMTYSHLSNRIFI